MFLLLVGRSCDSALRKVAGTSSHSLCQMCLYCMYIMCVDHLSPTSCCCCKPLRCRLAGASCCRLSERKVRCWVTYACGVTQSVLLPCPPPHRALCPLPCFSVSVLSVYLTSAALISRAFVRPACMCHAASPK